METLIKFLDSVWPPKEKPGFHSSSSYTKSPNLLTSFVTEPAIIRLAGISGALAVSMGAYGSHVLREHDNSNERRLRAFETGNRYHLLHSVALLAATKARYPWLTTALFVGGMMVFSGSCYHYGITGEESLNRYTPFGGMMYILAWLSLMI